MGAEKFTEGFRFDRYEILSLLGEGGMGSVWRATHLKLQKPVVIKTLRPEHARAEQIRARFMREGEAAARIRHPNVVEIFDVAEFEGMPYLVMEFLDGEDLRALLTRKGRLSLEAIVEIMMPVCNAVAAAHDEGVIHRDLKPENIFLSRTRDGALVPKVLDFGISRIDDGTQSNQTATGALLGTPRYMSPEQARGDRNLDARTDQYALGVVLYECATGRVPVDEGALYELLRRTIHGEFAPPRSLRPELPPSFESVILRAMSLSPASRFPSVRGLGSALLDFGDDTARVRHSRSLTPRFDTLPSHDTLAPPASRPSPSLANTGVEVDTIPERKPPARRVAIAAAACVAVALAGAILVRTQTPPSPVAATRHHDAATRPPPARVEPPLAAPSRIASALVEHDAGAAPRQVTAPATQTGATAVGRAPSPRTPRAAARRATEGPTAAPRTTSGLAID